MEVNIVDLTEDSGTTMAHLELREIRQRQINDSLIGAWRRAVIDKKILTNAFSKQDIIMKRNFKYFAIKRGLLIRQVQENESTVEQLVIPEYFKKDILKGLHTDIGHPGIERTTRMIRERFFWPGMTADIEHYVKTCDRCLRRKTPNNTRAPLVNVNTTYPLQLVCFDYLTLEPCKGKYSSILIITDHFTKFAMAIPTKNQTAKTTAEAFFNNFIIHYGIPTRLHSDQGANFESQLIKELCQLTNMKKSHTTAYHPQGNAGPERFNRTLINMLGTLENHQKADWKNYINPLVFAYNSIPHENTRVSPYELMFGRKPRLPIDAMFEEARDYSTSNKSTQEYLEDLKDRIKTTREIAEKSIQKAKEKQKFYYDRKVKGTALDIGDQVLVRILSRGEGKHKIADKFEEELFTVIEQPRDGIPVHVVKGNESEKIRKLHRNHLFPVHYRVDKDESTSITEDTAALEEVEIASKENVEGEEESAGTEEDSSSEDEAVVFVPRANTHGDAYDTARNLSGDEVRVEIGDRVEIEDDEVEVTVDEGDTADDHVEVAPVSTNTEEEDIVEQGATEFEEQVTDAARGMADETFVLSEATDVQSDQDGIDETLLTDITQASETTVAAAETSLTTEVDNTINSEEGIALKKKKKKRTLPPDPPRRSQRTTKIIDRYGAYISHSMTARPYDSRFTALEAMMSSGVLDAMDRELARKLVNTIME